MELCVKMAIMDANRLVLCWSKLNWDLLSGFEFCIRYKLSLSVKSICIILVSGFDFESYNFVKGLLFWFSIYYFYYLVYNNLSDLI